MAANSRGRVWGAAGVLAVLVLWLASAGANFWAGYTLTDDPSLKAISGAVSIAVDVMKAVALFVIVAAIANRRWVATGVAVLVFALCSSWSLRNAVYTASVVFGTADAERAHKAQVAASGQALTQIKTQRLGFLSQQHTKVDPKAKRSVIELTADENRRVANDFERLSKEVEEDLKRQAEAPAELPRDPIAWMLGLDSNLVITATSLFFALLVEFTSGAGFWMIAQARTPRGPYREEKKKPDKGEKDSPGGGFQLPAAPQKFDAPNVVTLPMPTRLSPRALLAEALEDVVVAGGPKERELTSVIMQRAKVRLPDDFRFANPQNVAMMLKELFPGVEKKKVGGQMYFYGVKLKDPAVKAPESRQAATA